jgi:hypothetical protein
MSFSSTSWSLWYFTKCSGRYARFKSVPLLIETQTFFEPFGRRRQSVPYEPYGCESRRGFSYISVPSKVLSWSCRTMMDAPARHRQVYYSHCLISQGWATQVTDASSEIEPKIELNLGMALTE